MCGLLAEMALVRTSSARAQQPAKVLLACEFGEVKTALQSNPLLRALVASA